MSPDRLRRRLRNVVGHADVVAGSVQAFRVRPEHGRHRRGVEVDVRDVGRVLGDVRVLVAVLVRRQLAAVRVE